MRRIIEIGLVILMGIWTLKPVPKPVTFQLTQGHINYIQDSIQPPPPFNQIEIRINHVQLPIRIAGETRQITINQYLILLNPVYHHRAHQTMYHELVHVKQMVRGDLQQQDQVWYWKGQPIDWTLPYQERPWEQRAQREAQYIVSLTKSNPPKSWFKSLP